MVNTRRIFFIQRIMEMPVKRVNNFIFNILAPRFDKIVVYHSTVVQNVQYILSIIILSRFSYY